MSLYKRNSTWESMVRVCPYCSENVNIHHISSMSEKHLIGMFHQSFKKHLKKCRKDNSDRIMIDINIEVESQLGTYAKSYIEKPVKLVI